jgi:phosphoribosylanthranilate isomerase
MTRVKICGITRIEDARLAVELGATALGFNFYSASPRYVTPQSARVIVDCLPPFVTAVGVFADEVDSGRIAAIARQARTGAIQLHGPRFPELLEPLRDFPLIRAVPVGKDFHPSQLQGLRADAILLDACDPERIGGSGKVIDWNIARQASGQKKPIILAGGLTPENVGEAIRTVEPYAVDVATGVESSPGIKVEKKLRAFFEAVQEADRREKPAAKASLP